MTQTEFQIHTPQSLWAVLILLLLVSLASIASTGPMLAQAQTPEAALDPGLKNPILAKVNKREIRTNYHGKNLNIVMPFDDWEDEGSRDISIN